MVSFVSVGVGMVSLHSSRKLIQLILLLTLSCTWETKLKHIYLNLLPNDYISTVLTSWHLLSFGVWNLIAPSASVTQYFLKAGIFPSS